MRHGAIRMLGLAALLSALALLTSPIAGAAPKEKDGKSAAGAAAEKPESSPRHRKTKKAKENSKADSASRSTRPAVRGLLESSPAYHDSSKK